MVTAEHCVVGAETKVIALMEGNATKWPAEYRVIDGKESGIPTADVAYAFGEFRPDAERLMAGIRPEQIASNGDWAEGTSFVSMGYPASRAKVRNANTSLKNQLFYVSGPAAANSIYEDLGLDRRVHIAVHYDPSSVQDMAGDWKQGAEPRGMSGGLLLTPMTRIDGGEGKTVLLVAGVLTQFRPKPHHVLIATRIDCVLDAIAPGRPESARTHVGKSSMARRSDY